MRAHIQVCVAATGSIFRRFCAMQGGRPIAETQMVRRSVSLLICLLFAFGVLAPHRAAAQGAAPPAKPEMTASCPGLVAQNRPPFIRASLALAALKDGEVRINYIGHSTFLLESPKLVRIATDYNDYAKPPVLPDIVTMNHAHSTHYTDRPDPGIKHVLRGWRDDGKPAGWDLQYLDVRVRSV